VRKYMRRAVKALVLLLAAAAVSPAQTRNVQMKIAGYLCGN
jgi:hypothetical protein